jgi:hypothetical protein
VDNYSSIDLVKSFNSSGNLIIIEEDLSSHKMSESQINQTQEEIQEKDLSQEYFFNQI